MVEVNRKTLVIIGGFTMATLVFLLAIYRQKEQLMAHGEDINVSLSACVHNQDNCHEIVAQQQSRITRLLEQQKITLKLKV